MAVLVRTTPAKPVVSAKGNSVPAAKPKAPIPVPTAHKVIQQVAPPKASMKPTAPKPTPPVAVEVTAQDAGQEQASAEGQVGEVVETKPNKPRVGLTEEEVKAAIEGNLEPRELKGTTEQSALTETDEHGRAKGRPIGVSTGLPILGAWAYVFQENEKNPDDAKLTDEQITTWMTEEFPGRDTPAFKRPNGVRDYYNRGGCTKNIIPKIQSKRYNADGTEYIKPPRANPFQKKGEPTTGAPPVESQDAGQGEEQGETPEPVVQPKAPIRIVKGPTHAEGSLVPASNASPITRGKPKMLKK